MFGSQLYQHFPSISYDPLRPLFIPIIIQAGVILFKKHPFRSRSLLGLDIQPDMARLVQLKGGRQGHQIERIAMRPMPANIFTAGKIQEWDVLSAVLAEWFELLGIKQQPAAISLPMSVVRVQRLLLPASLQAADIKAAITTHLQLDMPGLNEPLSIDFSVLPHASSGYVDVLFAAVREGYLSSYVECMQMAGLSVKVVDVDLYALMRVVNVTESTYAVLHVKNKVTEFIVFSQQEVIFHQQWETGELTRWTEQLNDNLQRYVAMSDGKELQKIVVCGAEAYVNAGEPSFRGLTAESSAVNCTNYKATTLDSAVKPRNDGASTTNNNVIESDYLVAYSLAMRALPPW